MAAESRLVTTAHCDCLTCNTMRLKKLRNQINNTDHNVPDSANNMLLKGMLHQFCVSSLSCWQHIVCWIIGALSLLLIWFHSCFNLIVLIVHQQSIQQDQAAGTCSSFVTTDKQANTCRNNLLIREISSQKQKTVDECSVPHLRVNLTFLQWKQHQTSSRLWRQQVCECSFDGSVFLSQ